MRRLMEGTEEFENIVTIAATPEARQFYEEVRTPGNAEIQTSGIVGVSKDSRRSGDVVSRRVHRKSVHPGTLCVILSYHLEGQRCLTQWR